MRLPHDFGATCGRSGLAGPAGRLSQATAASECPSTPRYPLRREVPMVVKAETTDAPTPGPGTGSGLGAGSGRPTGPEPVLRLLAHVEAGTTDMAERLLKVPLSYYRDP